MNYPLRTVFNAGASIDSCIKAVIVHPYYIYVQAISLPYYENNLMSIKLVKILLRNTIIVHNGNHK